MRRALAVLVLMLVATASPPASALPSVFHSPGDDGQPAESIPVLVVGTQPLYLHLETGPVGSDVGSGQEVCLDGDGDELCAWQVDVEATGGYAFTAFTPDPVLEPSLRWHLVSPTLLRINRSIATAGGDFGILRIGELSVDVVASGSVVVGASSQAAGAALAHTPIDGSPIAVPEPGSGLQWTTGLLFLAFAAWRRRRLSST